MKRSLFMFFGLLVIAEISSQSINPDYDSTLARKLGADDYGMKSYIMVILKTGTNNLEPGARRDSLFKGHMDNINKLADEGKLVIAGPLRKNILSYSGIFILNVKTIDEAKELLNTDPSIRENIFDTELFEWYGSAALSEYMGAARKIARYKF